jgi:hypothetical protein
VTWLGTAGVPHVADIDKLVVAWRLLELWRSRCARLRLAGRAGAIDQKPVPKRAHRTVAAP